MSRRLHASAFCVGLTVLFSLALPLMASAQYIMEFAQTYAAPTSNFISNTFLNQEALINATRPDAPRATAR